MFERVTKSTGNVVFISFIREAALAIQRNLRGWRPFMASPVTRAEGYQNLRARIAARDADEAERLIRRLYGVD